MKIKKMIQTKLDEEQSLRKEAEEKSVELTG